MFAALIALLTLRHKNEYAWNLKPCFLFWNDANEENGTWWSARQYFGKLLVTIASEEIKVTSQVVERTKELTQMGFKPYDALHIACAEVGSASIFLTTDDRLLRKAKRLRRLLRIRVENPVHWLMEVIADEGKNDDAKSIAGSGN